MSVLLDVALGSILVFLVFSIVVSGINEWIAQASGRRGHYLRLGLQRLIDDEAIYRRVLHHPLIGSMYREGAARGKPPSYVDANNFSLALAHVLLTRGHAHLQPGGSGVTTTALRVSLRAPGVATSPVSSALGPILDRAGNDLDAAFAGINAWFDTAMDRVGGWYKARTQKVLFAVGLVLACAANVDTIEIVTALNRSSTLRSTLAQAAEATARSGRIGEVDLNELRTRPPTAAEWASLGPVVDAWRSGEGGGLPIGYACLSSYGFGDLSAGIPRAGQNALLRGCTAELRATLARRSVTQWLSKIAGWILTALAGTLGATYWFALLNKVVDLRGAGRKPVAGGGGTVR